MSTVHRLGWVAGAKVLDACGVEHIIQVMQHGYVQCSWPGYTGLRNYRRRELQLLIEASDDEESRSSTSERNGEDPLSDGASDREDGLVDEGTAPMSCDDTEVRYVRAGAVSVLGGACGGRRGRRRLP